jgi:hypothetical protein
MKKIVFASCAALLLALPLLSKAQTTATIAQWTFENLAITNYSPNPLPNVNNSKGAILVSALGMTNFPTTGFGTNDPDVLQGVAKDSSAFGIKRKNGAFGLPERVMDGPARRPLVPRVRSSVSILPDTPTSRWPLIGI